jgi:hypothetical protein
MLGGMQRQVNEGAFVVSYHNRNVPCLCFSPPRKKGVSFCTQSLISKDDLKLE